MATLTQEQQSNFTRVLEGLTGLFGEDEKDLSRTLNALKVWGCDEDKTLLPSFLDKFGIPTLEHNLFLNWVQEKEWENVYANAVELIASLDENTRVWWALKETGTDFMEANGISDANKGRFLSWVEQKTNPNKIADLYSNNLISV